MKNKPIYITWVFMMLGFMTSAQKTLLKKANSSYVAYAYQEAIETFEYLEKQGYETKEIYERLGHFNYNLANYAKAAEWYGRLMAVGIDSAGVDIIFKYAHSLKSLEKYEESENWMNRLVDSLDKDQRERKHLSKPDYLKNITSKNKYFEIEELAFNTSASEFAPAFRGNHLIYASNRKKSWLKKNVDDRENEYFFDLYSISQDNLKKWGNYGELWDGFKTKTHESTATFTKDGKTVYFTRNNSKNGKFARDSKGVSRLKIYRAYFINNNWSEAEELPFNNDEYSVAHPALNKDEDKLYFSSDMPGTIGNSDIFYVDINNDGTFGSPINMGPHVNTESRETFPFISLGNILYFASDGHPGLGGLDLFAMELGGEELLNLGEPVNSPWDDFSMILDDNTQKGFIASNRKDGMGGDDIYAITNIKPLPLGCETFLLVKVVDYKTNQPISNANLEMISHEIGESLLGQNGFGEFQLIFLECDIKPFTLNAISDGYEDTIVAFDTLKGTDTISIYLKRVREPVLAHGTDLFGNLNLNPVYFELNSADLQLSAFRELDKVYLYLKENSAIKIEVRAHTDSRGSDAYNMRLSQKRAESTVAYFISKGIDPKRIKGIGYGESKLLNYCKNGSKCSNKEHEYNRRSEFIIVE